MQPEEYVVQVKTCFFHGYLILFNGSQQRGEETLPCVFPKQCTYEVLSSQITLLSRPMHEPKRSRAKARAQKVQGLCRKGSAGLTARPFGSFKRAQSKGRKNNWLVDSEYYHTV